jgi:hypothetical protein
MSETGPNAMTQREDPTFKDKGKNFHSVFRVGPSETELVDYRGLLWMLAGCQVVARR